MTVTARRMAAMAIGVALLAAPLAADAQESKRVPRIGYLSSSSPERDKPLLAAFRVGLRELGYQEDKTILIEQRHANGQFETLPALAAELVRLRVDLLVVAGAPAAHAAKSATRAIPIVMTNAADPVGTGLVASLARPGGNVTGLSDFNAGVVAKRLELLKEVAPSVSRVAALVNPANPTNPPQLRLIQAAAPTLAVTLLAFEVRRADEIERAFDAMARERAEALIVMGDPLFGAHGKRIVELAMKNRLPATYANREWPTAGGLMSYGTNFGDLFRRAATYVDKVLKGTNPANLPIEQPSTFELVINLKTVRALGLTMPPSVLLRAEHVIE